MQIFLSNLLTTLTISGVHVSARNPVVMTSTGTTVANSSDIPNACINILAAQKDSKQIHHDIPECDVLYGISIDESESGTFLFPAGAKDDSDDSSITTEKFKVCSFELVNETTPYLINCVSINTTESDLPWGPVPSIDVRDGTLLTFAGVDAFKVEYDINAGKLDEDCVLPLFYPEQNTTKRGKYEQQYGNVLLLSASTAVIVWETDITRGDIITVMNIMKTAPWSSNEIFQKVIIMTHYQWHYTTVMMDKTTYIPHYSLYIMFLILAKMKTQKKLKMMDFRVLMLL
jgi:hypothetical protein